MSDEGLSKKLYAASEQRRMSMLDLLGLFKREGSARVTDLHLKVGKPPIYRVDGDLHFTSAAPLDEETMRALAGVVLDEHQLRTLEKRRSVNASRVIEHYRYRFNAFHDLRGLSIAIRALDTQLPTIEFVGFPNGVWQDIIKLSQGLVLVTGATGAGKSTTIAALIHEIARTRACHIITLEDPIEYEFPSQKALISQRAIGRDVPNYEQGIRDALREDPDVIFVGEMTDAESTTWALTAAETGHLVFSGLHTRNAVGTITRIVDMFPVARAEETAKQVSLSLRFILSQKLIQREGTYGRIAAMEVLTNTGSVGNLVRQMKLDQIYSLMQTHTRDESGQRMTTMERTLARMVEQGVISRFQAEQAANEPQALVEEMKRI
ncbi:PilT/PilU family type 4a pilus ATPase [Candidatus Uhrbacteria bacterium]|nr:PilT/PilU family type 4a pilus ATPase [Candidatus Uhrbacteria bacterium]